MCWSFTPVSGTEVMHTINNTIKLCEKFYIVSLQCFLLQICETYTEGESSYC